MEFEFIADGALRKISLKKTEKAFLISDGETVREADIRPISENELVFLVEGRSYMIYIARDGERKLVYAGGRTHTVWEPRQEPGLFLRGDERTPEGGLHIKAPMPGKVIKLNVAEGEEVRKNQTLAIVEAMKMENEIKSSIDGIVKKIHVAAGELVDSEKYLIELEPKNAGTKT